MRHLPTVASRPECVSASHRGCTWHHHNYKHFPAKGITPGDTRWGPAKYLPEFKPAIRELETETTRTCEAHRGAAPGKTEYLRNVGRTIGWDAGTDAPLSYVECSGGEAARAFHGRPMRVDNPVASAIRAEAAETRPR